MTAENIRKNDGKNVAKARLLVSKASEAKKLEKAAMQQLLEAKAEYRLARKGYKQARRAAKFTRKEAKLAAKALGVKLKALIRAVERASAATKARPKTKARLSSGPVKARSVSPDKSARVPAPPMPARVSRPSAGRAPVGPAIMGM